jgi:murein hydrolase activator
MSGVRPQPPRIALEPQGGAVSNAGRMKPAIPFHQAKGQLPLPAAGRRVLGFGEKNQFGRQSRGIVIETRHAAAVVSPSDAWVVYAGEFRSYGQVLILNAGGGYHILLANLARVDVEVGRFVLAGEPVGAMSSNTGAKTQEAAPVLYVEFRNKEGQSIDPTPWWVDGSQKVQG